MYASKKIETHPNLSTPLPRQRKPSPLANDADRTLVEEWARDQDVAAAVVVGHHAPSRLSTHPRYSRELIMNGGYSSELDDFIQDHPQIKLWTHGHTHEDFDYMIAGCRILCNPRGYINYEERADTWRLKTVEV